MDLIDFLVMIGFYAASMAILFAFIWAVWNWIVVPTVPYIVGAV